MIDAHFCIVFVVSLAARMIRLWQLMHARTRACTRNSVILTLEARCLALLHACTYLNTTYRFAQFDGETVLHLAIAKRRGDLVKYFLEESSDNEKTELLEGKAEGVFELVGFTDGRGIKCCKFGEHPLCWAAVTNQPKLVDLLLEHGANIDCETRNGDSILHMLVRYGTPWSSYVVLSCSCPRSDVHHFQMERVAARRKREYRAGKFSFKRRLAA
jgi:hypothetical protein